MQADVAKEVETNRIAWELSPQQEGDRRLWWPYRKKVATLKKNPVFTGTYGGFCSVPMRAEQEFLPSFLLLHVLCQLSCPCLGRVSLSLLWVDITPGDDTHVLWDWCQLGCHFKCQFKIQILSPEWWEDFKNPWIMASVAREVICEHSESCLGALLGCLFQQIWWDRHEQTERRKDHLSAAQTDQLLSFSWRYFPFQVLHL